MRHDDSPGAVANEQRLVQLIDRIHGAKSLDSIFLEIQGEILAFVDAERMTLYAVDPDRKQLYSKFLALDAIKEIRVPISEKSVAGFVAKTRQTVNVADAYDAAELRAISPQLAFDASWDRRTGFRTVQILAMPVLHDGRILGVIQLLNALDRETGQVIPFDPALQPIVEALASLAAVALESYTREQGLRHQIQQLRIEIDGTIASDAARLKMFDTIGDDASVKAVVIAINSPGGTTAGGEELYEAIGKLRAKKPVVAYVKELGASAAYMAAIAADRIFVRRLSIVGSIGVLFQTYAGYYQNPAVLEALGLEGRPPHPKGYEIGPDDPQLLDPVRARAPFYREP